jgi:hypothetical protein
MGPWAGHVIFRVAENFAHICSRLGNVVTYSPDTLTRALHYAANACKGVWVNAHTSNFSAIRM